MSAVVYLVLERRNHGNTIEDLREDVKRREDQRVTALSLTELIEKEGDAMWSDKLLEDLGPWLMVQLSDMANSCESMRKFVSTILLLLGQLTHITTVSTSGVCLTALHRCSFYFL
jgi:hypothetical protein